jgi:glycerol-3-phosphate dehydrogenase
MHRDLDTLSGRTFDVLVVGGGICGLGIAYDAAQRGLSVALVERGDFGGGASFNHLRTIHGGLRYLQSLDVARARESLRERRTLARIAPYAVRPLPFVLPLGRSLTRGRLAMRAGFLLDRVVAWDRHRGVQPGLCLPAGRVLSRAEAASRFPVLRAPGLTGAAVWHDYITPESDRLTFAFALAAHEHGAVLANYVDAADLLIDGRRVTGVRAVDRRTGHELSIAARVTVNATGAAVDRLPGAQGAPAGLPMMRAMNLVTRRTAGPEALGGRSASGRFLFLVPWRNRGLFGTWESATTCAPDTEPSAADVSAFIAELNQAFPSLALTPDDITLVHRGVVPAAVRPGGRVVLEGRERVHPHAGLDGIVSVAGTKYTTARAVAEKVVDRVLGMLRLPPSAPRTAATPLPGGDIPDVETMVATARQQAPGVAGDTTAHLVAAYGSRYNGILALAADRPQWLARVGHDSPVIGAELVWAARHEMAVTLADAVVRRTPLGALGYPGEEAARRAADLLAPELGWDENRKRVEIDALRRFYALP